MTTPVVRVICLPSGPALVRLTGELDLAAVPALRTGFADALQVSAELVADLREVTFIDAAAIGTLVWTRQQALAEDGSLWLVGASPWISRILRIAQVNDTLPSLPDLGSAFRASSRSDDLATAPWGRGYSEDLGTSDCAMQRAPTRSMRKG
jgi:anti-sigma B factor antagonist